MKLKMVGIITIVYGKIAADFFYCGLSGHSGLSRLSGLSGHSGLSGLSGLSEESWFAFQYCLLENIFD